MRTRMMQPRSLVTVGVVLSGAGLLYRKLRAPANPDLGRDRRGGRGPAAGGRAARGRRRRLDARDHDRRARRRGVAVACADGPVAARRRLHL